ncbi:MAG TPA: hypothetical protein VJT80_23150 [Steroidobacteraceae bacterium]|nr:hypothetical protein [Steroidobacteraceae bacterium]
MPNTESTLVASDTLHGSARRPLKTIVFAGLVAGALDITYAFIIWGLRGVSPIRIGQSVASGLLGREAAVGGGTATGLFGLLLHFTMAIIIAAIYYTAARNIRLLVDRAVPCGIAFGLVAYGVMNYVVMPLSAIGVVGDGGPAYIRITGILVHMFLIGLPIALFTRRDLR